jgi:hypothetical protein
MQNSSSTVARYRLIGHDRENRLIINMLGQETCFLATARDIMTNSYLLEGFLAKDAALIGYMAGLLNEWEGRIS